MQHKMFKVVKFTKDFKLDDHLVFEKDYEALVANVDSVLTGQYQDKDWRVVPRQVDDWHFQGIDASLFYDHKYIEDADVDPTKHPSYEVVFKALISWIDDKVSSAKSVLEEQQTIVDHYRASRGLLIEFEAKTEDADTDHELELEAVMQLGIDKWLDEATIAANNPATRAAIAREKILLFLENADDMVEHITNIVNRVASDAAEADGSNAIVALKESLDAHLPLITERLESYKNNEIIVQQSSKIDFKKLTTHELYEHLKMCEDAICEIEHDIQRYGVLGSMSRHKANTLAFTRVTHGELPTDRTN